VRLLIAEGDRSSGEGLASALRGHGYVTDLTADGDTAVACARHCGYSAALIAWQLPRVPGVTVTRRIRIRDARLPVLLLGTVTAADRVAGLDAGADDFLPAPPDPAELAARIRALHRRPRDAAPPVLAAGHVTWDPATREARAATREARAAGRELPLTLTEAGILELLIRRSPAVVSRAEVARHVWECEPGSNAIAVHVMRVRAKLPPGAARIETVRGIGYRLRAA
jgi:two-component system OmpR family response regulator